MESGGYCGARCDGARIGIYVSFTGGYCAGSLIKHGASRSHCGLCGSLSVSVNPCDASNHIAC